MTVFLKRDRSLRLITTLPEQNTCRVCAGGVWYQCSSVSPTCFHSFRAGSGGKFEPEGSVEPDEEMCCVFPATCWLAVCLLGLVVGVLLFIWSCLSLTDFGGRIKDFNFKEKKKLPPQQQKLIQRCWLKGTSAHVSCTQENSESLTNVNSHNVLNSQVSEKLQVFGTCRNFALYLSVTRLFRAAFIFLSRHTDSFQT